MDDLTKPHAHQIDDAAFERDDKNRREKQEATRKEKLDDALDKALEESFPGSDPISVAQPPQSVHDKHDRQKR